MLTVDQCHSYVCSLCRVIESIKKRFDIMQWQIWSLVWGVSYGV